MAWQVEDADANRQQLTIAEFGEAGGPGMGGCPAGPANTNPTPGTYSAVRSGGRRSRSTGRRRPTSRPRTPVSGYSVVAIAPAGTNGEQKVVGTRTGKDATRTTLTVDAAVADYTIEVRSIAGGKMGAAFAKTNAPTTPTAPGDTTPPTVTATQGAAGAVTLAATSPVRTSTTR